MNIPQVRHGIANALAGLQNVQVSEYVLAQPTPPGIQIIPPGVTYNYSMGSSTAGINEWAFIVQGFVALTSDIGAQKVLDDWCAPTGSTSVRYLLEADRTLGGVVDTLVVTDQTPGRSVESPPGNPMLLVEWHLTVYAKGT